MPTTVETDINNFDLKGTAFTSYSSAAQKFLTGFKYAAYKGNPGGWQDVLLKWNLPHDAADELIERKYHDMLAELSSVASRMDFGEAGYFFDKLVVDYRMLRGKPGFKWVRPNDDWVVSTYNKYMKGENDLKDAFNQGIARLKSVTGNKDSNEKAETYNNFDLKGTAFTSYSSAAQKFLTGFKYAAYKGNPGGWQDVLLKWNLPHDAADELIERKYHDMLAELSSVASRMDFGEAGYFFDKLVVDYRKLQGKPGFKWVRPNDDWVVSTYNKYMKGYTALDINGKGRS